MTIRSNPSPRSREKRCPQPTSVASPGLPGEQYRPLTDGQVSHIHDAALEMLERTGIEVMPSSCREVWRAAGARIDAEHNRVFISRRLVAEGLAAAGLWTRDVARAHRVSARLKAGVGWINTYNLFSPNGPFGDFKQSGYGRDNSEAVIGAVIELKSMWVSTL